MNKIRIKTISLFTSFFFGMALLLQPLASYAMTLDELIAAAQKEGEVNTYWHSSRMGKKVAKAFEEKYGIAERYFKSICNACSSDSRLCNSNFNVRASFVRGKNACWKHFKTCTGVFNIT